MPRPILPYLPRLKALALQLRQNMTFAEVLLWNELKRGPMQGFDFDRQRPIDAFIVDFYCKDLRLAIEVDGESHSWEDAPEADARRQDRLEALGVRFLRFTNADVKQRLPWVLDEITHWIRQHAEEGR